ncbi:hypothetical protein NL676_019549 [Syzygium grande]|nr:hypothetical protein NL676_019549 [Syzygium grande]
MTSQLPAFEMIYQYASSSRIAISIRDPVVSLHLSTGLQKMETLEATTNLDRASTEDQARPEDFKQQILSLQPGLGSRRYEMARPEVIRCKLG